MTVSQLNQDSVQILGCLTLADGSICGIGALDPKASRLVSRLVKVMRLSGDGEPDRMILVRSQDETQGGIQHPSGPEEAHRFQQGSPDPSDESNLWHGSSSGCEPGFFNAQEGDREEELILELMRLSQAFLRHAGPSGCLLLHSALIEHQGQGFLLAGPSGAGKSTAAKRVPPPWRTHSDDATLLARDSKGGFWAHPWPTWSELLDGGSCSSWDVQSALPLNAVFFIHKADRDLAQVTGKAEALSVMLAGVEQAMPINDREVGLDEQRESNLKRFESVADLTKNIPCFNLGISKTGAFWREIERACSLSPA